MMNDKMTETKEEELERQRQLYRDLKACIIKIFRKANRSMAESEAKGFYQHGDGI